VVTARDVTAAKLAQAELEAAHVALQRLVAAQDKVQEDERKRIARELHDDLQQTLAAIMWEAAAIRARLRVALPDLLPALSRIDKLSNAAVFSTRRIVNDLRPQMLEDLGLVAALEALAVRFTGQTAIPCHVEAEEPEGEMEGLSSLAATCLFRVAQESLTNVAKHADAHRVRMQLLPSGNSRLTLRIHDDGKGLGPEDRTKPQSFGLLGMSERVHAIGGTLQIHSEPGAGTTIEVEVPLTGRDGLTTQGPHS
jgi:signal transduction histidine kinase